MQFQPLRFGDLDTEVSCYKAAIRYKDGPVLAFDGSHETFSGAARRAVCIARALYDIGEEGARAWVTYGGAKPQWFPKNGVQV
jgi:hypothetical protein